MAVFDNSTPTPNAPVDPQLAMLREMLDSQAEQRAELAQLRAELQAEKDARQRPVSLAGNIRTAEEMLAERISEIAKHPYYCPGCGKLYTYQRECRGRPEAVHPPIDVISTDELQTGDASKHTPAPDTTNLG